MSGTKSVIDSIEETIIAVLLGCMTLLTFANVVARYAFNSNILWALELTVFMFAWLVLLGASYAVKTTAHLGVDAIINTVSPHARRTMGLIAAVACVIFAMLLTKGAWDYWANFANLPKFKGENPEWMFESPNIARWFPLGFEDKYRGQGWYETNDIPVPSWLGWLSDVFNDGIEYEKIPRLVPYLIMPLSMALLLLRTLQAAYAMYTGKISMMIVGHEVEEEDIAAASDAINKGSN
ncbi:TRAP transporter small permease [Thalassobium sp. R2A62]|uniref:TRAP transporter small permease n=1 Tax=Thalassobium sp. R2A62 TaxID=633131 RepID=UPI0001B1D1B6|nr:TRAP transporter small permease [Thalassobium sp. R2A62]EET46882.1 trap transporter, dctq subunit [Thalassobium sp. R2A62]